MCDKVFDNTTDVDNSIFYWEELAPTLIVFSITFALGLVGNCLIIYTTFQYRRMQCVTNIFLSSLASADLLLIAICIPVKLIKLFSYTWTMGFLVCKGLHYVQNVSAICSVMTLTAISVERYYAIIHPMKAIYVCTINQAKWIILIIWIASFTLATPTLSAVVHLQAQHQNDEKNYYLCVKAWDSTDIWQFHEIYMLTVILILPFTIMTFSYTTICWEVWKIMKRRSYMTSVHVLVKSRNEQSVENFMFSEDRKHHMIQDDINMVKQVIYMLVTVVILFAICWGPLLVDNILVAYSIQPIVRCGFPKYLQNVFHLMTYFNSCLNPIIYGFMSKSFRESFLVVLCCSSLRMQKKNNYSLRGTSRTGSQTRTTSFR